MMPVEHDARARRFLLRLPAGDAYLAYSPAAATVLDFYSTWVPPAARGQHIGADLVRTAMDYAREHGFRVIPSCWYVHQWIQRHPEYQAVTTLPAG